MRRVPTLADLRRAFREELAEACARLERLAPLSEVAIEALAEAVRARLLEAGAARAVRPIGAVAHLSRKEELGTVRALLRFLTPRSGPWRSIAAELRRGPVAATRIVVSQRWPLALKAAVRAGLVPHLQDPAARWSERARPSTAPSRPGWGVYPKDTPR